MPIENWSPRTPHRCEVASGSYTSVTTQALEKAFAEVAKLPAELQDRFARWILDELEDELRWDQSFARTEGTMAKLAAQAREAVETGESDNLDAPKL